MRSTRLSVPARATPCGARLEKRGASVSLAQWHLRSPNQNVSGKFFIMAKALFFLLAASLPVAALANDLTPSCQGQGAVIATQTTTVNQFQPGNPGHNDGEWSPPRRGRPYTGTGTVEIKTGTARMRVPDASGARL